MASKKHIYIYDKKREDVSFLKDFFVKKRAYRTTFFTNLRLLRKKLQESPPALVIADSPAGISKLNSSADVPRIAMISSDVSLGLRTAVKNNVNCYLISPFYEEDLEVKIDTAIQRENWFEKLYREQKDLEAIVELSHLVTSTLDPKDLFYFIVKKISRMIDVTRCSILSMGSGMKEYAYVVSSYEDPSIGGIRLDLKKYPEIEKVIFTKKPLVINNALKDKLMLPVKDLIAPIGVQSIMVIPIIFKDELIGTLFLRTSKASDVFSERDIRMCKAIANVSSSALYNAFLFKRLEDEKNHLESLAITDYLTEVFNIRYLYHRLEEEFCRAMRYKSTIGCIMLDIDYFKKINDTYGHKTGDAVLREFAQLVKRHTRRSDIFARYGGEEFILIMPQTTSRGSLTEAHRLMEVIRRHDFPGIKKTKITVSMGIAHLPDIRIKEYEDLITLADNALFEAKNKGRNMVVMDHRHIYAGIDTKTKK